MNEPRPRGREIHEGKPDPGVDFRGGYAPSTREQPKYRVGNADRAPLMRIDRDEAANSTGKYVHERRLYHVFVNHVGSHIELLIAMVGNGPRDLKGIPDASRSETRLFRCGGDATPDSPDIFDLYLCAAEGPVDTPGLACGKLRFSGSSDQRIIEFSLNLRHIQVDPASDYADERRVMLDRLHKLSVSRAYRYDDAPNLLDHHLNHPWVPPETRTLHWFPITSLQEQVLPTYIMDVRVGLSTKNFLPSEAGRRFSYRELVENYYEPKADEPAESDKQRKQWQANIATALDTLVKAARGKAMEAAVDMGGIDEHQTHAWRRATLARLDAEKLSPTSGSQRTLLTETQRIIDDGKAVNSLSNFADLLWLVSHSGKHHYDAEMQLAGIDGSAGQASKFEQLLRKVLKISAGAARSLGQRVLKHISVSGMAGLMTLRKNEPGAFEANYVVVFGGLKAQVSAGDGKPLTLTTGKAEAVLGEAWLPEQLDGVAFLGDLGIGGSGGGTGKSKSITAMVCHGSGPRKPDAPLHLNFSGLSDLIGARPGLGVSGSLHWGAMFYVDSTGGDVKVDIPEAKRADWVYRTDVKSLHFPINGALLTAAGERLLDLFAANELAMLSQPEVRLEVSGYADQPDTKIKNLMLSRNRAMSAYNYLKNILGDDLKLPELKELPNEEESFDESKGRQRDEEGVQIFDPGSKDDGLSIVGHGEPSAGNGDENVPSAKYDPALRRVDIELNGTLRVTMQRPTRDGR